MADDEEDSAPAQHRQDAEITITTVRQWIDEGAPRWPPLPEERLASVARACEHERRRQELRSVMLRHYESRMLSIRDSIRSARRATAALLDELPAIEAEINRIAEEWETAGGGNWGGTALGSVGQEHLQICGHARQALLPLKEILRAMHQTGGQRNEWTEFAGLLADHLRLVLECAGSRASLKEGGPLASVIANAVEAATGAQPSADAVAKALQRRAKRRKNTEEEAAQKDPLRQPGG